MPCKCLTPFTEEIKVDGKSVSTPSLGSIPVSYGNFASLPKKVQRFVVEKASIMKPRDFHVADGSDAEGKILIGNMQQAGMIKPLKAYENNWIVRTDPKDVARVESKTCIITPEKYETVTHTREGITPLMGNWWSQEQWEKELDGRFPGCMSGRTMFIIPFSMGPVGSHLSEIGIELTDSNYVVVCMRIMTRVSPKVLEVLKEGDFVQCIHSVGVPLPLKVELTNNWPCCPEKVMISHRPHHKEIWSFGSGYGGNSLLGKKCFALRIAGCMARDNGWMAEHMLIMGITPDGGKERFVGAAFPSACGKTNLAMLLPTIPGYKVRCVGDDIAWMRWREDGQLVGINPESGFFGVAPGTSHNTNPMAMDALTKNCVFTNTAETADGEFFWEGLEDEIKNKDVEMITWLNEKWKIGQPGKSAHPNSRFTAPAAQCPIIHPKWEDPSGVPIDAFIFGGRRPEGVPLIFEAFSWLHGIYVGACLKSESTAAAEHAGKKIMHDPMAMRPFMGYNFGRYLQHWISMDKPPHKVPRIYHVNWFRVNAEGKFIWPGFCENIRVLAWILQRLEKPPTDRTIGKETAIGVIPTKESLNTTGLDVDFDALFNLPKDYWVDDAKEVRQFMEDQVGPDLPAQIRAEMDAQEQRINAM